MFKSCDRVEMFSSFWASHLSYVGRPFRFFIPRARGLFLLFYLLLREKYIRLISRLEGFLWYKSAIFRAISRNSGQSRDYGDLKTYFFLSLRRNVVTRPPLPLKGGGSYVIVIRYSNTLYIH